ncbi:MAG: hypothetical protein COB83_09885 [Gammaproteobacteria bacterium]|nr:MAG: hypothetical protein COB83_09885 [Gammaproteobacteria bacterium]
MIKTKELNKKDQYFSKSGLTVLHNACALSHKKHVEFEWQAKSTSWVNLCMRYHLQMVIWEQVSRVDIAIDEKENLIGWFIHRRKTNGGDGMLPAAVIEAFAKYVPYIGNNPKAIALNSIQNVDGTQYTKALITSSTVDYVLNVNSANMEIISIMPEVKGQVRPLSLDDKIAHTANDLLWHHLKDQVKQHDMPASNEMDNAFRLNLKKGIVDENNIRFYSFMASTFFSECHVDFNENNGEPLGWYIEAFKADASEVRVNNDTAIIIAKNLLQGEEDIVGPEVTFDELGEDKIVSVYWWHKINNIIVEGDQINVAINAQTGQVFAFERKWRKIATELLTVQGISGEQALNIVNQQRESLHISADLPAKLMEKKIIEVAAIIDKPSAVRDCIVWCIGFSDRKAALFIQVAVEHTTGKIVRVTGW